MSIQECNRFRIHQRFTALINRFDVYDDQDELIGFTEQKRFNLRESVTVWKSEGKDQALFTIAAEKVFDIHGKYFVVDENGQVVGYLRKVFMRSLIRSTWGAYDTNDTLLYEAIEKNLLFALLRRIGAPIEFLGELLVQLPQSFVLKKDNKVVGYHRRLWGIRDKYEIAVEGEAQKSDKRILLALGLLLDILQRR